MKIQILQGINLENNVTTVKILFDKELKTTIIDEIKNYHPIFLKSYTLNKNSLQIQTKLPNLWREIAKVLNQNITEKEMKQIILEKIIRKQIKSMSTISTLDIADKMNEEITAFLVDEEVFTEFGFAQFNRQYCIGCGVRSAITVSSGSSKDSQLAKQIQTNKYLTNILIDRLNMPTASWEEIKSEEHLKKIFNKYNKPVVIKPTSLTGGHGVNTNIKTIDQAITAYKNVIYVLENETKGAQKNKIIIQQQVQGDDYRLLVINGKLEAATKRIPAFVLGDGKSTIKELIEKINKDPKRDLNDPTHTLKPILIDKALIAFLQEQNLNLKYIPKNNKKITIRKVASMSQGGITEDFTEKTHKNIKHLAESLAQSLRAYVLGVDVICKDISKPLDINNGAIIEVNTMPESYLNMFPVLGPQRPQIAQKFVEGLLDKPVRKIAAIGGKLEQIKKLTLPLKGNTGIYSSNSLYINGLLIKKNTPIEKARQALKINAYLNNIVFHYETIDEVKQHGLGFDYINTLYISKNLKETIKTFEKKFINNIVKF